jgi:hypothetical protein
MAMKDFHFKQYMLQKGEIVGLFAAGGLAVVFFLFMLVSIVRSASPSENKKKMLPEIDTVRTQLRDNVPNESEKPKNTQHDAFAQAAFNGPRSFVQFFNPGPVADDKRGQPLIKLADEGKVAVVRIQARSYIFSKDLSKIMVLKDKEGGGGVPGRQGEIKNVRNRFGRGGIGDQPGSSDLPGGGTLRQPTQLDGYGSQKKDLDTAMVPVATIEDTAGTRLAETIRPVRAAIIVASFPYKDQLEEFRRALRMRSIADVLQEGSFEKAAENQNFGEGATATLAAFRFSGVNVQRRVVDSEGKPLVKKDDGWQTLNLEKDYLPYIVYSGQNTEPDDPKLDPVIFDGLFMPRLQQFRENQYPPIEMDLKNIKATLDELAKLDKAKVGDAAPLSRFSTQGFNMFRAREGDPNRPNTGANTGGERPGGTLRIRPPEMGGLKGGKGRRPGVPQEGQPTQDVQPPEHCLVRVLDVTVEPGKTYQYRIQVRMANPNYLRADEVRNPNDAKPKEITSNGWFQVPQNVVVPPELVYYAVDQKKVDSSYKGINANVPVNKDQIVLQIHRWLVDALPKKNSDTFVPVGEWSIAERMVVTKGEYVGRKQKVDVAIWRHTQEAFSLATNSKNPKNTGIDIDFAHEGSDSILVDFEGGKVDYKRLAGVKDDKPVYEDVKDEMATEVLLLSPEGNLLSHNSKIDAEDKERIERLKAWRERIKEVREGKGARDAKQTSPFLRD